ncbi:MAG: carboxypeptidase-like regulatory domain-containing protein, partial [Candidatus Helarchaeota archaeon]
MKRKMVMLAALVVFISVLIGSTLVYTFIPQVSSCQPRAKLTVTVIDQDSQPLEGVNVSVQQEGEQGIESAMTNNTGHVVFYLRKNRNYELQLRKERYYSVNDSFYFKKAESKTYQLIKIPDTTPPVISSISVSPPNATYIPGMTFNFSCIVTDPESDINSTFVVLDSTFYQMFELSSGKYQLTISDLAAGNHSYFIHANNTESLTSTSSTQELKIKKSLPNITLHLNGTEDNITIRRNSQLNVTVEVNPNNISTELWKNSTLLASGLPPLIHMESFTEEGNFIIKASVPETQNFTSSQESLFVTVWEDNDPPEFYNASGPSNSTFQDNCNYTFTISVVDENSSVGQVKLFLNGTEHVLNYSHDNIHAINVANLSAGYYKYYFLASDVIGNENQTSFYNFTVFKANVHLWGFINGSTTSFNVSNHGGPTWLNLTMKSNTSG